MARALTGLVLAIVVGACESSASGTATLPVPTPFPEVAATPSFQAWATDRILAFRAAQAPGHGYIGLGLQILAPAATLAAAEAGEFELIVSAQEPPADWFATPLGRELIVLAVNPINPVHDLLLADLARIFRGQSTNWSEFGGPDLEITPVIPLRGDELREALGTTLLEDLPFTTLARLGPSPEATLALVREHPGAIGILPLSAVGVGVDLLQVGGVRPASEDARYPLHVEVLGLAPREPVGAVREWLAWLQANRG